MSEKATEIANLLSSTVDSLGLELLGVEYLPAPGGATLRLYIDVPLAEQPERVINVDDCERVSREVSAQLDVEDPISGNYTLEVSSPGVDRPLFTLGQFARHAGESAKIVLKLAQDGRRRFQGEILRIDAEAGAVVFAVDGKDVQIGFDNIDKARILPDWVALGLAPQKPNKHGPKNPGTRRRNHPTSLRLASRARSDEMSKELLLVVDAVANEKGVPREVIFDAIEAALASAAKKRYPDQDVLARVTIDHKDGTYETYRRWEVVADDVVMESPDRQVRLMDAIDEADGVDVGDYIEEQIENPDFGRIAAQAAKQVIVQRVREAERQQVVDAWKDRVGELITGVVKRAERGNIFVDLGGNAEAFIPKDKGIPRDVLRPGDRVRGYLAEVRSEPRGPQLFISRAAPEFMIELFKLEVPEVGQGLVEIKACARDPGDRAKIAVIAHDARTDPIGACIGMRGSRVQAISNELNGERVDIVLWNENPANFVINAMAPAEVQSIIVDEDKHSMDLAVAEDRLAQAIGKGGQNVRLASRLTGWQLNVMTADQVAAKSEAEQAAARQLFMDRLEVDEEISAILVSEGFNTVEEIAYVPVGELLAVEGFDEDIVEELRARARDALLNAALAEEEGLEGTQPTEDLLALEGMDEETAVALAEHGVRTSEDLSDLAADEIVDFGIEGLTQERAAALILAARAEEIARLERGE